MDHDETGAFIPEVVEAVNSAYAAACEVIEAKGGDEAARLRMAEHMLRLARNGETDPDILCCKAILAALA